MSIIHNGSYLVSYLYIKSMLKDKDGDRTCVIANHIAKPISLKNMMLLAAMSQCEIMLDDTTLACWHAILHQEVPRSGWQWICFQ